MIILLFHCGFVPLPPQKFVSMETIISKPIPIIILSLLLLSACGSRTATPEAQPAVIHLTTAEFRAKVFDYQDATEWKYLGDKAAVIDFYATWCGPCKVIAPVLEELAAKYADSLYIYKIDVDKEPELSAVFDVMSIPTLLFIPLHGDPQMAVGALPKEDLEDFVKEIIQERQ